MRELRVPHVVQGCSDKVGGAAQPDAGVSDIDPLHCACIVDDTPDLPLMSAVGFAAAVADAHPMVLSAAHWVARGGGRPRARCANCATPCCAPAPGATLMLFRVFTVLAVVALAISTWILSSPARRPARQRNAQADGPAGLLSEERRAHRLSMQRAAPSIRIEAERIDQVAHGNEVALYNVRVNYEAPSGQTWVHGRRHRACSAGRQGRRCHRQRAAAGRERRTAKARAVIHTDTLTLRRARVASRAPRATCASISAGTS